MGCQIYWKLKYKATGTVCILLLQSCTCISLASKSISQSQCLRKSRWAVVRWWVFESNKSPNPLLSALPPCTWNIYDCNEKQLIQIILLFIVKSDTWNFIQEWKWCNWSESPYKQTLWMLGEKELPYDRCYKH